MDTHEVKEIDNETLEGFVSAEIQLVHLLSHSHPKRVLQYPEYHLSEKQLPQLMLRSQQLQHLFSDPPQVSHVDSIPGIVLLLEIGERGGERG